MSDFKLRAPPRVRMSAVTSVDGVIGQGGTVSLSSSAMAGAQGVASLLRGIGLSGAASASAQAAAALLRGIRLSGAAVASAQGSPSFLSVISPPLAFNINPYTSSDIAANANPFKSSSGYGGAKHVALAWHPIKRRVYSFQGDYDYGAGDFGQPDPGSSFTTNAPSGAQTYTALSGHRSDQYSIDPYAATATVPWRLEQPFKLANQSGSPEPRPPITCQSCLVWDSARSKFWGLQTFIRGLAENSYNADPWACGTLWSTTTEPSGVWSWAPGASGSPGVWTRETTNALVYRQGAATAFYEGSRLVTGAGDERIADFAYSTQHDVIATVSSYVGSIVLFIFKPSTLTWEYRIIPKTGYNYIVTSSSQTAILGDWIYVIGLAAPSAGPNRSVLLRANLTNALALSNGQTFADNTSNWEVFTLPFSLSAGGVWEASGDYSAKWSEHAGVEAVGGKIVVCVSYDGIIDGGTTKMAAFAPSNKQFYIADAAPENIVANAWCALPETEEILFCHSSPGANYANKLWRYRTSHLGPLSLESLAVIGTDALTGSAFDSISGQTYVTSKPRWWMYSQVTKDGTIIRLGDDAHGQTAPQWNGLREFNPVTGATSDVYPNNFNRSDVNRMNNKAEFYIGLCNYLGQTRDLWVRAPGGATDAGDNAIWDRVTSQWLAGALPPASSNGRRLVGTGASDLWYRDATLNDDTLRARYNPHFAWSTSLGCGFILGGSPGGNDAPAQLMWLIVPSTPSINATAVAQGNPFTIYQKSMPDIAACTAQWGEPVYRMRGAMACCFAGEYVYWLGGDPYGDNVAPGPFTSKLFFRMKITPHLSDKNVSVTTGVGAIQRLSDAPTPTNFGLLSFDTYLNCIVAWVGAGSTAAIWAYDLTYAGPDGVGTWVNVTPANWTAAGLFGGDSLSPPLSCQGGFVDRCSGQILRKHIFSPGRTTYGATNMESFFALKLKRS